MAKRSDTIETVILALEILRRIPKGTKRITARELHEELLNAGFKRDLRTIQRHLDDLSKHFQIVRDDRSKPYGYSWLPKAGGIDIPTMTTKDSLLLMLVEEHLKYLLPSSLMKSMERFFQEAKQNLGLEKNAILEREWIKKVKVVASSQPLIPPQIDTEVFSSVSNALYNNKWLTLTYRNANERETTKDIMPLGLAQQGTRLYLVCRYKGYENERSLAIHRIVSAHTSTMSFDRPKDFDLKKYDDDGRFGFGEGQRIRLTFHIDRKAGYHIAESKLSDDQTVEEIDENTLSITATVVDSAMLDWWLRGFGDAISYVHRTEER